MYFSPGYFLYIVVYIEVDWKWYGQNPHRHLKHIIK